MSQIQDILKVLAVSDTQFSGGNRTVRSRITVAEWNGQPVTATEGRELLEAAGFVRDYQGLTLYAAWR